jgi:hypothetical protein
VDNVRTPDRLARFWLLATLIVMTPQPGLYGKGYPRGKKTAAGHPPWGRATPQTVVRPFGGWPARRAYKGWAWRARMKL